MGGQTPEHIAAPIQACLAIGSSEAAISCLNIISTAPLVPITAISAVGQAKL